MDSPVFLPLTCVTCAHQQRVMIARNADGSERYSDCRFCGSNIWLNLPPLELPIEDIRRLMIAKRRARLHHPSRRPNEAFDYDPDAPESQDWYYEEND